MKNLLILTCLATLSLTAAPSCFAADSPWDGTWKENFSKSKLSGDTFVITEKPGGAFHYSDGGAVDYDFTCDGKPHSTFGNRTLTCSGTPEAGYDYTTEIDGRISGKSHRTFSADGKTMTIKGTGMLPDGSTSQYERVDQRQTGTTGLAGKWLNVKLNMQAERVETWSVKDGTLHVDAPALKLTINAKLDGSAGTVSGPTVLPGATVSFKSEGQNKITYTVMLNDKTLSQGTYTVSADGKTLTDENWIPGHESEKSTELWDKQ